MKFADVKNDVAFRKIFGNESRQEALISFLNAVLDFHGPLRIAQVTILNPYQLPRLRGGKVTIVDVKATDQAGRTYIIEMQVGDVNGFEKRVLYYSSKSYSDQIKRADFYRELRPVIFIGVLDFIHTLNPHYISRNQVRDIETGEQTIRDMEFNFIELPKFNKDLHELQNLTDKWIYFLKNAENLEVIPADIHDPGLKSAYEQASIHTWTQAELDAYDYAFMREEDERARLDKAVEVAVKAAVQAAVQATEDKQEASTVLKLHKKGKTAAEIAELLDISVERVLAVVGG